MMLDTPKKNRLIGVLIMILCLVTYCMLYSTKPNVSTKPKSKSWKRKIVSHRHHKIQTVAPPEKKILFRPPVKWNNLLTRVIHGTSIRGPRKSADGKHIRYGRKPVTRDVLKTKDYHKMPKRYYGDCFSYSAAGARMRPTDVLKRNECKRRLPKAMIVGVKKCGTMMLTQYLALHPLVAIRGEVPVPTGRDLTAYDIDKWRQEMQLSSPRMFTMTGKPLGVTGINYRHIPSLLDPNAKIIMIVRDPVVRAVSDYVHTKITSSKMGSTSLLPSFNEMVIDSETGKVNGTETIVAKGRYIEKFRGFKALYGPDQMLVLDGEAFVKDPLPIMTKTEQFLGLPKFFERKHFRQNPKTGFYCANVTERPDFKCANPKIKGRPHPQIDSKISEKLYEYYRPFNHKLAREANFDSDWLLR